MLQAVSSALRLPDLRQKLLFTFAMLVVFRFIAHVPVPGIDPAALERLFQSNALLGMFDLFSGGAMRNFSIAAMGVYPYITASIIMQLLTPIIPQLQNLQKEGESGRNRINMYTHWLTVPLAALQGYGQLLILSSQGAISGFGLSGETLLPTIAMVASLTAGTILLVWIGELITENGIGNGVSIIIFGGIVANLPQIVGQGFLSLNNIVGVAVFGLLGIGTVYAIVIFNEAQRRIPVQYARRVRGTKVYGGQSTHIPLRVNSAGMIPLIFAMSIVIFPGVVASWFMYGNSGWISDVARTVYSVFDASGWVYWLLYFTLVVGFTFFYTMVIFEQQRLSENLQKYGGFVPGIRPGRPTSLYLNKVLLRITWAGALFLGIVAVLPFFARTGTGVQALQLSSTGLLIIVGVVLDMMRQLEAQLLMRHYEGFIK